MSESVRTHPVILTTRTTYAIPSSKYMIPTSWARYHLSQLINKVLSSTQPIPFDFLVNGELLTGSLAEWCKEHNLGEEETLEIEYIESVLPPEALTSQETKDWMTLISCQHKGFFLTSSYDGCVRVYDSTQQVIATIQSHNAPVTSVCWVPEQTYPYSDREKLIASSSLDHTLHLNRLTSLSDPSYTTLASLHLHTAPVSNVSASTDGQHIVSAGWDGLVGIWSTTIPEQDEVPEVEEVLGRKKRRKMDDRRSGAIRKGPVVVLKSHVARVSKAIFDQLQENKRAYSCGWDSTVRSWDVESGVCVNTVTLPDRAHLDLALSQTGTVYVASADRSVSVIDFRLDGVHSTTKTLSHPSTPSCLVA
ncbi:unnamed protein product, partial [Rhizoctonia solani]